MRIRDIIHASGLRLRISLDRSDHEALLIQVSDPAACTAAVQLDSYGGELLAGFLMSARLAHDGELGDERCHGPFGCHLRLINPANIELRQDDSRLLIPQLLWDRLYAELMLVLAHSRNLAGLWHSARGSDLQPSASRLLH
jgi:hypothetical protein